MPNLSIGLPQSSTARVSASPAPIQETMHQSFATTTPEDFSAEFTANFPPVQPTESLQNVPMQLQTSNPKLNVLDNLFQTNYPDPFRETQNENTFISIEEKSLVCADTVPNLSSSRITAPGTALDFESLPNVKSPSNIDMPILIAPKIGHRRNMSDTSAFNKYYKHNKNNIFQKLIRNFLIGYMLPKQLNF